MIVFRYQLSSKVSTIKFCKDYLTSTEFIEKPYYINNILHFIQGDTFLSQLFDIGVGYVSGAETIMKNT